MKLNPYLRSPHYYETDQMAIVHHSNYIRWFEEARVAALDQMGLPMVVMEQAGITTPVLSVSSEYKSMVRFGDTVAIQVTITQYTGTRLSLTYRVVDEATGELRNLGTSSHCFLKNGRPISLKRAAPEFDAIFLSYTESE